MTAETIAYAAYVAACAAYVIPVATTEIRRWVRTRRVA